MAEQLEGAFDHLGPDGLVVTAQRTANHGADQGSPVSQQEDPIAQGGEGEVGDEGRVVDGDPSRASCYFKDIDGKVLDRFDIISDLQPNEP